MATGALVFALNAFRLNPRGFLPIPRPVEGSLGYPWEVLFIYSVVFAADLAFLLGLFPVLLWLGALRMRFRRPDVMEWLLLLIALIPALSSAWFAMSASSPAPSTVLHVQREYAVAYLLELLLVGLLVEEVLFRSVLQAAALRLRVAYQVHIAIGLLFLLSHLHLHESLMWRPGWMFMWCSVAYAYRRSLTIPIAAHVLHNASWVVEDTVRIF